MTKLDEIANLLEEILEDAHEDKAAKLHDLMHAYGATYGRSLNGLRKQPGFRKLWSAMYTGTGFFHFVSNKAEALEL